MTIASLGLAFIAGILSTLSPCVLPLLPIVLGTAASEHKLGPVALALGLALAFVAIGLFVATIGFAIGLDGWIFRSAAGGLLIVVGATLAVPFLQERFAVVAGPAGQWAQSQFGAFSPAGLPGQFGVGLLLGAVWSPCVGPTVGAAAVLASQGKDLAQVAATMVIFGFGAALPLVLIGLVSREATLRLRSRLLATGGKMRIALGGILIAVGLLTLTGLDKAIEAALISVSPAWLIQLSTRF